MTSADLCTLSVPIAKRTEPVWRFRASPVIQSPEISDGALVVGLILDLGFSAYKKIRAEIRTIDVTCPALASDFAVSWCHNAAPNDLQVVTWRSGPGTFSVDVYRTELDLETLKPIGETSLADALVDQGLAISISGWS